MSAATFDADLAAVLVGRGATRLLDDRAGFEKIPQGGKRFQLRVDLLGEDPFTDSNQVRAIVQAEITVLYRLDAAEAERAYTLGAMLLDQAELVRRGMYRDLASVHSLIDDGPPEVTGDQSTREGDIISYTVQAQLRLA